MFLRVVCRKLGFGFSVETKKLKKPIFHFNRDVVPDFSLLLFVFVCFSNHC